jgi:hypothetical protein
MAVDESKAAILARLARDINCMADADRHKRRRALQTVLNSLLNGPEVRTLIHTSNQNALSHLQPAGTACGSGL